MAKNHHKIVFTLVMACVSAALYSCRGPVHPDPDPVPGSVVLHTVWDMNREPAVINSHKGEELESTLQIMYPMRQIIPHSTLLVGNPSGASETFSCYPRIKRMTDGGFIMFYHSGQYGSRIWCTTSRDFKSWTTPYMLYEPYQVDIKDAAGKQVRDTRRFVNPDAVVLPSGEILMVCSYRASGHYGDGIDCGLSTRKSANNGKTWSQPRNITSVGANWEPYLMLMPDGSIHCYYTDAIPQTRNSGTALIISKDGGDTWSEPIRVCAQYKYDFKTEQADKKQYNGQKIYTDQMPCFRILNDGKTIVGWMEARLETPTPSDCGLTDTYNSHCMMSLVRNHSLSWTDITSYDAVKEGPADRQTNVMKGSAGYVSTFPSGEVVLACNQNNIMSIKLGDCEARNFRGAKWTDELYQPLEYKGFWSTTEAFDQNFLAVAMHSTEKGMQLGMMYLNHRIDAPVQEISVDGDASEWESTRALYLSAPCGDETIIRACHDRKNLYLAVERSDENVQNADSQNIIISNAAGKTCGLKIGKDGATSTTIVSLASAASPAVSSGGAKGYVCEVSIPLSSISVSAGESIRIYADIVAEGARYPFTFADPSKPSTWQKINLK